MTMFQAPPASSTDWRCAVEVGRAEPRHADDVGEAEAGGEDARLVLPVVGVGQDVLLQGHVERARRRAVVARPCRRGPGTRRVRVRAAAQQDCCKQQRRQLPVKRALLRCVSRPTDLDSCSSRPPRAVAAFRFWHWVRQNHRSVEVGDLSGMAKSPAARVPGPAGRRVVPYRAGVAGSCRAGAASDTST